MSQKFPHEEDLRRFFRKEKVRMESDLIEALNGLEGDNLDDAIDWLEQVEMAAKDTRHAVEEFENDR
jgi:hypothetical protein